MTKNLISILGLENDQKAGKGLFFLMKFCHLEIVSQSQEVLRIFKLWGKFDAKILKVCKIHWKLKFSESQYCFANISAKEAWIFMKFYVLDKYYLAILSFKFHEDPYKNARACFIGSACVYDSCSFMHGSWWNLKLKLTR